MALAVIFVVGLLVGVAFARALDALDDFRSRSVVSQVCTSCGGLLEFIGFCDGGKDGAEYTFWYCPACDVAADGAAPEAITAIATSDRSQTILASEVEPPGPSLGLG